MSGLTVEERLTNLENVVNKLLEDLHGISNIGDAGTIVDQLDEGVATLHNKVLALEQAIEILKVKFR